MSANFQELGVTTWTPERKKGTRRPRIRRQHLSDKPGGETRETTTTKRNKVTQHSEVKRNVRRDHDEQKKVTARRISYDDENDRYVPMRRPTEITKRRVSYDNENDRRVTIRKPTGEQQTARIRNYHNDENDGGDDESEGRDVYVDMRKRSRWRGIYRIRNYRNDDNDESDESDESFDDAERREKRNKKTPSCRRKEQNKVKLPRIPSQRLTDERNTRQGIVHNISDDDDEEIDKTLFTKIDDINISVGTALLMWPLKTIISGDFITFTPISPPFNRRDVGESRLTVEVKANNIEGSTCHAMFGSYNVIKEGEDWGKYDSVRMASIFSRYTKQDCTGSHYFSNIGADEHNHLRDSIQGIVDVLSANNTIQYNNVVKTRKANLIKALRQNPISPTRLLIKLMLLLDKAYNGFNSSSCYEKLLVLVNDVSSNINSTCLPEAYVELNATLRFQRMMRPYCLILMDGSHRHSLMILEAYRLPSTAIACNRFDDAKHKSDEHRLGFRVYGNQEPTFNDKSICNMSYKFYDMNIPSEKQIYDYSYKQLQQVSANIDLSGSLQVKEETIHKILEKCGKFVRTIESDKDMNQMEELVGAYLNSTESQVNNSARAEDSYCNRMRSHKELLREKLSESFFPSLNIKYTYVQGITYIERFARSCPKEVFKDGICPSFTDPNLLTFLLLDCILIPTEVASFLNVMHNSYSRDHADDSAAHNISHSEIWNSPQLLGDMVLFTWYLIDLMKDQNVIPLLDGNEEVKKIFSSNDNDSSNNNNGTQKKQNNNDSNNDNDNESQTERNQNDSSNSNEVTRREPKKRKKKNMKIQALNQKRNHCCQQYAFFVALHVVQHIGMYPVIEHIPWKFQDANERNQNVGSCNIFSMLLHILAPGQSGGKPGKPTYKTKDFVVDDDHSSLTSSGESSSEGCIEW